LAELDQWINGLAKDVESSFSAGPKRDALLGTVRQLLDKYNALQDAFRDREQVANDWSWDKKGSQLKSLEPKLTASTIHHA
jgi:hypothetical protein